MYLKMAAIIGVISVAVSVIIAAAAFRQPELSLALAQHEIEESQITVTLPEFNFNRSRDENPVLMIHSFAISENSIAEEEIILRLAELSARMDYLQRNPLPLAPPPARSSTMFSWMSYRAITNRNSRQWALQQYAETCEDGLRRYNGLPMVAVGTGWGAWVGDVITVTFTCNTEITVIVGDIKSDRHTCPVNRRTVDNGCYLEFIVDVETMCRTARRLGSMAGFIGVSGRVYNVKRAPN